MGADSRTGSQPISRDELVRNELGSVPHDLFGIALSGGGIRSATFSLGLLQSLRRTGLLERADYISTVSGGGYTGGFWSAWRHHNRGSASFPDEGDAASFRHLRRFSNFLSPRLGVFSYDTGRLAVAALTAAIPTLLATIALLVLAAALWSWIATEAVIRSDVGVGAVVALSVIVFTLFEVAWSKRETTGSAWTYAAIALVALATTFMLRLFALGPAATVTPDTAAPWLWFVPAIAWAGTFFVLALVRGAVARYTRTFARVRARAALDRVLSRLLFLTGAWSALTLLWLVAARLHSQTVSVPLSAAAYTIVTTVVTTLFVWSRKLGTDQPSKPFGSALAARLKPRLPQLLAWTAVLLIVTATMIGVMRAAATNTLGWTLGLAAAITAATLLWFHPNRIGLHSFYRSRLARAFLGAARASDDTPPFSDEADGDDIPLGELKHAGPLHLVCCTVNDLTPREPLLNFQRGGASAVLSRRGFAVTSDTGLFWTDWRGSTPTLGAAITASGAAFNSMMGSFSRRFGPAATFVLAMLNLRLGLWLRHPASARGQPEGDGMRAWLARQRDRFAPWSSKEWVLPGILFYRELFGVSRADAPDVHLSDGGHFENMAVYELIRRRCSYIIAADCGADPDRAFDDVANLIRRVRQDFSTEIRIDLSPLYLDDKSFARQSMVAGDIHYPDGNVGVLLVFKPTLTGSEPPDILQYRTRNPRFPNESTGDQFYDEAQWESYRRLGQYAGDTAFEFLRRSRPMRTARTDEPVEVQLASALAVPTQSAGAPPRADVGHIFSDARFEWLPKPAGFAEQMQRFVGRAAAIDGEIAQWLRQGVLMRATTSPEHSTGLTAYLSDSSWLPQGKALDDALLGLRRALLFMEETWYAWDLERTHAQPLSLGVMNYFGRWAATPLMHVWWPLLKALHSPPFAAFMERSFGLVGIQPSDPDGGIADVITETQEPDPHGYAAFVWRLTTTPPPPTSRTTYIGYHLHMRAFGATVYSVQAGMLCAVRTPHALIWNAPDFFVPPGLWGIGIGEDFLRRMRERQATDRVDQIVRLRTADASDTHAAKSAADQLRMFRAAGFAEAGLDQLTNMQGSGWITLIRRAPGFTGDASAGTVILEP